MYVSQYGLGFGFVLLIGAVIARHVMIKALDKAEEADAKMLSADKMAEKRKVKSVVTMVLNAELVIMPVLGYWLGATFIEPR